MLLPKDRNLDDKLLSMDNTTTKGQWLDDLLNELKWTPAELSKASRLDSAVISNIRNGKRDVGIDTAVAIGKAVGKKPEAILRMAGKLPPDININGTLEDIINQTSVLSASDQAEILSFIRWKNNQRKKK